MAKYDGLRSYLPGRPAPAGEVRMTFVEVEALVGPLPASARNHRTWWANDSKVQAQAWRAAGWHVSQVNLSAGMVAFARGQVGGRRTESVTAQFDDPVGAVNEVRDISAASPPTPLTGVSDAEAADGAPESAVQAAIVIHLVQQGWTIRHTADTATKERGIDVLATRNGRTLAVEVKGFPSRRYRDPRRAEEIKPTAPTTQARHWYAQAILKAMLTRGDHADYDIAIALPDAATYRGLVRRTRDSLDLLGIQLMFVAPNGSVTAHQLSDLGDRNSP